MTTVDLDDVSALTSSLSVPSDLNSPNAKLVYLYVRSAGQTTVDDICTSLGMKRLVLFGVLPLLVSQGYLRRDGDAVFPED
jgi:hypothetical protein